MAVCLPFLPGLSGGFLFDDKPNIVQNFGIQIAGIDHYSLWRAANSFPGGPGLRPLAMLTFALDFWLFGLNSVAFKLTNLAVHAATCIALAQLCKRLLLLAGCKPERALPPAIALAVAWGVHPLQVSSVLYVVQRMQTLSTLFLVLALLHYMQARQAQIAGTPQRKSWLRAAVFWALALACKEDAALLPTFTLGLELTLLRFNAHSANTRALLQRGYLALTVLGGACFLLLVAPHLWSEAAYPGRNFNSAERLLTQCRVLAMYLGQAIWPSSANLPFYYDNLLPSRSLTSPITTLWSLLLLLGLIAWAWGWRKRRPLFALGLFLFFSGHFITSNVIGLELAFEHRNHFPLFGLALAAGDLLYLLARALALRTKAAAALCLLLLLASATATGARAYTWGNPLRLAQHGVQVAPDSIRAWSALCRANYDLSLGKPESPYYQAAITTCAEGGKLPGAATVLANVVILKSLNGTIAQADWDALLSQLQTVTMNVENAGIAVNLTGNALRKKGFAPDNVLRTIAIVSSRTTLPAEDYIKFGQYVLVNNGPHELAHTYLLKGLQAVALTAEQKKHIIDDLKKYGYGNMAERLEIEFKQKQNLLPETHNPALLNTQSSS